MPQAIKVLCVDDNDLVCGAMARRLCPPLFEFVGSEPTYESLEQRVSERRPDLLILDLDVPGSDALGWIRRNAPRSERPRMVVLTGMIGGPWVSRALDAGADGVIAKSEDAATIVDLLVRAAGGENVISRDAARALVAAG